MVGRRGQGSRLPELPLLVGFFQQMPGQDGHAIENSFARAIGLRQLKNDGLRIQFLDDNRFPANDQKIPLWGVDAFVEIHAESEEDIIRIQRLTV